MEFIFPVLMGVGLSAACGFRIFVPLLALSIANQLGLLPLSPGFEWIGADAATAAFAVATILEISGYFIPWLDHLLDTIATPAAILAGILATASLLGDFSPLARWALAIIAGGGVAGMVQASTVALRGLSLTTTGGLANPAFSLVETLGAAALSLFAILIPIIALILVVALVLFVLSRFLRKRWKYNS
jgi:uncharacterized membrane protein